MMNNTEREEKNETWPDGVGMIYLAMSPWEGMRRNRHQLMSRFAVEMPVLYVEPSKKLRQVRQRGVFSKEFLTDLRRPIVVNQQDYLYLFQSPDYLAVSGSRLLGSITENRWLRAIRQAAASIGIVHPILWVSVPAMRNAVGRLGEALSIYHIVDEYSGYTMCDDSRRRQLIENERNLLDSVDMSIVVSQELLSAKAGDGRYLFLVENAVDFRAFRNAVNQQEDPADLANIRHPRLGYSGLIGKRLNLELIAYLAKSHPEWSIVLVGQVDARNCESEIATLGRLENVHFMGEKRHDEVPAYIAGLDIGLLPYEVNLETVNISPLKMYEYLAVGIPIVSTNIPAVDKKRELVAIASDASSFVLCCEENLNDRSELLDRRVHEASLNTWEDRVTQLSNLIIPRLNRKRLNFET
jgi:glycosyltransferase involved in cell wall biosynthesis